MSDIVVIRAEISWTEILAARSSVEYFVETKLREAGFEIAPARTFGEALAVRIRRPVRCTPERYVWVWEQIREVHR